MTASKEDNKFAQVVQKMDPQSKLLRTWELKGGVSAQVSALEFLLPDGYTKKMIIRQHGAVDLKHNPQIAADEFKLLQLVQSVGLAAPKPFYLDQSGEIFSTPYLVIEYVEGETEFTPSHVPDLILQLATQLSRIHTVDCSKLDVSFLPQQEQRYAEKLRERPTILDESLDEGHIRDALGNRNRCHAEFHSPVSIHDNHRFHTPPVLGSLCRFATSCSNCPMGSRRHHGKNHARKAQMVCHPGIRKAIHSEIPCIRANSLTIIR